MRKIVAGLAALGLATVGAVALSLPAQAVEQPTTCTPIEEVSHVVHHEAVTHVVHHDAVTHVVHHDAVTHEETVVDTEAWDEVIPATYTTVHHDAITHTEWKYVKHGVNESIWVNNNTWKYLLWPSLNGTNQKPDYGWYYERTSDTKTVTDTPAWDEQVVDVPEHTVHHDAVTHTETVTDQEAYDETVVDQEAYDETIVDVEAYDETVIDVQAKACPEKPEPRVTTKTWNAEVCTTPADGTATKTTYGQDTTYPVTWDEESWTYGEGDAVKGDVYTVHTELIDSEECAAPTPTPTPTPSDTPTVTPTPTPSPSVTPVVTTARTTPPTAQPELASTGSNSLSGLIASGSLIVLGTGAMLLRRKLGKA